MSITIKKMTPYKTGKKPSVKNLIERNFREVLASKMSESFPDIVDAQIQLAKGYEHTKMTTAGPVVVKKDMPDTQAAKLLFEYTLPKAPQTIEHKGSVGIVHLIAQLENGDSDEEN